jgi:glycosyltransferase 2 family protein
MSTGLAPAAPAPSDGEAPGRLARGWARARRPLIPLFFLGVAALLVSQARQIDWAEVSQALRRLPVPTLAMAAALAAASYLTYTSYDLLGRAWTRHTLPRRQTLGVAFISYAFNLNLGALVGGVAFRLRLYTRLGLSQARTLKILALSMTTNWLGYAALAGALLLADVVRLPARWSMGPLALQVLGAALISVVLAYGLACAFSRRRSFTVRGQTLELPSARLAGLQLLLSMGNWLLMGLLVYALLQQRLPWAEVQGALLMAAVAGVVTHVPAGLGVLEAVFIALLGRQLPHGEILAALLAYRVIYYLVPLGLATVWHLRLEAQARR